MEPTATDETAGFRARQEQFARSLTDPAADLPAGVTTRRGVADATRFAVYRNNVTVGLVKALEKRFPVTARLVGVEFFAAMARDYMRRELPSSPILFDYGDGFADFIEAYDDAAGLPYLADVARVEAVWTRAYHAEDAPAMTAAGLGAIEPQELAGARLARHPATQLVRSPFPVGSIWAAHQKETVEPPRDWRRETVLVTRPDMQVTVCILPERDAAFAAELLAGETLGDAAGVALARDATFDFGPALVGLVSLGAFRAPTQQGKTP
ncbi:DUF2063 domain-containing protein [Mesorhizobium sp. ZMM04-5]|uniref:DUF2063 domain-containing protein n=1 Tax=Mesorhizobium marinum TaxID=3228790 RepID=A0ABV3R0G0_9HYPH